MLTAVLRAATFVVIILICGVLLLTYLQPWLLASVTTAGRLGDIPSGCQTSERQTLTDRPNHNSETVHSSNPTIFAHFANPAILSNVVT